MAGSRWLVMTMMGGGAARPAQALLQLKTRDSRQVEIENEAQWTPDQPDLEALMPREEGESPRGKHRPIMSLITHSSATLIHL